MTVQKSSSASTSVALVVTLSAAARSAPERQWYANAAMAASWVVQPDAGTPEAPIGRSKVATV